MSIFKKKASEPLKKIGWDDVKVGQYNDLVCILNAEIDDDEKTISLMEFFFGEEVLELPLDEYKKGLEKLLFLKDELPERALKNEYTINGNKYVTSAQLNSITTAQYLEYTKCLKDKRPFECILACFLFPKGHKYNDGYDMQRVYADLREMSIVDANSVAFFFKIQYLSYTKIFLYYLKRNLKKMGMTKKELKKVEGELKTLSANLESCLTY